MLCSDLARLLNATEKTPGAGRNVSCAYACDLLSHALAHGRVGMAFITVRPGMNTVAVAVLTKSVCIILPDGVEMEPPVLEKARAEGIDVLSSPLTGYEICARMAAAGVPPVA